MSALGLPPVGAGEEVERRAAEGNAHDNERRGRAAVMTDGERFKDFRWKKESTRGLWAG